MTKLLNFLKNFPPWIVLMALTIFFVGLYYVTQDVAYKEWSSLVLASLFTALGIQRQQSQTGNTEKGDVFNVTPMEDPPAEKTDIVLPVEEIKEEK